MNDSTSRARQAAIYARVSSEEQATDGNSLNDQVARTEALIKSRAGQCRTPTSSAA